MADASRIEWTEATWNPVTGCRKISAGCKNCYAERMAKRLQAMGKPQYANGFKPAIHPKVLDRPAKWARPRIIFVNSMSDLFLREIPFDFVRRVFDVMNECDHHVFQVLTKRPEVAVEYSDRLHWSDNICLGATVEDQDSILRIAHLRAIPAKLRFLSLEPLLTPLRRLPLRGIHWVIAGGESGPGSRPMHPDWVRDIRDRCVGRGIPFFFKQWGGVNKKKAGRILDGRTWDEMPLPVEERLAVA